MISPHLTTVIVKVTFAEVTHAGYLNSWKQYKTRCNRVSNVPVSPIIIYLNKYEYAMAQLNPSSSLIVKCF